MFYTCIGWETYHQLPTHQKWLLYKMPGFDAKASGEMLLDQIKSSKPLLSFLQEYLTEPSLWSMIVREALCLNCAAFL